MKDLEIALIPNINIKKQKYLSKLIINYEAKFLEKQVLQKMYMRKVKEE